MMYPDRLNWVVKTNLESIAKKDRLATSGGSTGICPADPRAAVSQRIDRKCWWLRNINGDWILNKECLIIKCSTHKY